MKTKAHLLALEENKTLRSYLREIYKSVGHGSTVSDVCPAEMLAVVAFEVASEITEKDKIIAEKEGQISQMENLIKELYAELDKLYGRVAEANADLAECRINLREAEAKPKSKPHVDEYEAMLSRIGTMIPLEFFQTPESSTEQAVALLLHRYCDVMAEAMYTNAKKLEVQP